MRMDRWELKIVKCVTLWVMVAGACLSCRIPSEDCVEGIRANKTFRVELLEAYDDKSTFKFDARRVDPLLPSCQGFDGLGIGSNLEVRTTKELAMDNYTCAFRIGVLSDGKQLDPPVVGMGRKESVQVLGSGPDIAIAIPHLLQSKNGCSASWSANVIAPDANLLGEPVPGQLPPAIFSRRIGGGGCKQCVDYYSAKVLAVAGCCMFGLAWRLESSS